MILITDIGNTNIILAGVLDEPDFPVQFLTRIVTDKTLSEEQYGEKIHQALMENAGEIPTFEGAILSSSVPAITQTVTRAEEKIIGQNVLVVGPGIKAEVNLGMEDPSQLGPDLLVGAVGCLHKYEAPVIIFDMGTCTTISVIDKNSCFLGGMIAPGVATSQNGMLERASHLPKAPLHTPSHLICGDTVEAIQSGLMYGHAAMTDGMIERIWEDLGYETTVIATGGLAPRIVPLCKKPVILEEELLIDGLMILYRMNR